jgi:hypothetical protein
MYINSKENNLTPTLFQPPNAQRVTIWRLCTEYSVDLNITTGATRLNCRSYMAFRRGESGQQHTYVVNGKRQRPYARQTGGTVDCGQTEGVRNPGRARVPSDGQRGQVSLAAPARRSDQHAVQTMAAVDVKTLKTVGTGCGPREYGQSKAISPQ